MEMGGKVLVVGKWLRGCLKVEISTRVGWKWDISVRCLGVKFTSLNT